MISRRTLLAGSAAGASLLSVPRRASAQTTKLTLGHTSANAFMPAFVAKENGLFERNGTDVALQRIPTGSTMPAALIGGSLDIAGLTAPVFLIAVENGLPLQIVAGSSLQTADNPTGGVLARKDAAIRKPEDFVGKRVGAPGLNGAQHVTFMRWLKDKGVDAKRVTFIEAAFPQMGDMLRSGQIDATLPVEPFLGRIIETGAGEIVARYLGEISPSYLESFWVMTKPAIQKNPKAVEAFRASLREATQMIAKDPALGLRSQVQFLGLKPEIAMQQQMPTLTAEATPAQMQFWIDLLKEFGILRGEITGRDVVAS
jgi:NitT/TauT family transport system substrate-binding protein